jgi:hypothetical protein
MVAGQGAQGDWASLAESDHTNVKASCCAEETTTAHTYREHEIAKHSVKLRQAAHPDKAPVGRRVGGLDPVVTVRFNCVTYDIYGF